MQSGAKQEQKERIYSYLTHMLSASFSSVAIL